MLDILRWAGAQAVCIGHALNFFGVGDSWRAPNAPYMQNIGVMVFFVLSGFVIAHALLRAASRPHAGLGIYVVDRFARIYSVLIPAMILIALSDVLLLLYDRHLNPGYVTVSSFFGTLAMMNNYSGAFKSQLAVASFGSAGHLWSLAVEWHIYMFAGGLYFLAAGRSLLAALVLVLIFASVPLEFFGTPQQGAHGAGLSYLWFLGFSSYFLARARIMQAISLRLLWLATLILGCYWLYLIKPGAEYDPKLYPLLASAFLLLVLATQRTGLLTDFPKVRQFVRRLADYSFSLYLVHYSLLYFLHAFWPELRVGGAWTGIILSNVIAWVLATQTEYRHREFALWLKRCLGIEPRSSGKSENLA